MRQCAEADLLCDAHPPVGVDVSSLQLGLHPLPHTDSVRVPLLDSCSATSTKIRPSAFHYSESQEKAQRGRTSSCFGISHRPLGAGVETLGADQQGGGVSGGPQVARQRLPGVL